MAVDPNSPAISHEARSDITVIRNSINSLRNCESSATEPSNLVAGMFWFDTTANILKLRNEANTAWQSVWDFGNNRLLPNVLAPGELTADTGGRAKMADLFVTNAKVNDVAFGKITGTVIPSAGSTDSDKLKYATGSIQFVASDVETSISTVWSALTKAKEIRITRTGAINVYFELACKSTTAGHGRAQIYKNGEAVGTLRSNAGASMNYTAFTEDISVTVNDLIQLYIQKNNGSDTPYGDTYVRNFRFRAAYGSMEHVIKETL